MIVHVGLDVREAIGLHVFAQSLWETSPGVAMLPLSGQQGDGSNAFTYKRFDLFLEATWAIFVDGADMMLRANIKDLWALRDKKYAVQVVKHDYQTKHSRKYIGTEMESENSSYPRKNWSSVMLVNGSHITHFRNRSAIKEAILASDGAFLHRFAWCDDEEIGELPVEWNWLDEFGANEEAKLVHYTNGIPGFAHYATAPHAAEWKNHARSVNRGMA